MKVCTKCKSELPADSFGPDKRASDGLTSSCRSCKRAYYASNPEKRRVGHLRRYKITPEGYQQLLDSQGGSCAICKGPHRGRGNNFHVDHCHITGKVRGLLCGWCNPGVGYFEDDIERMLQVIEYLRRSG